MRSQSLLGVAVALFGSATVGALEPGQLLTSSIASDVQLAPDAATSVFTISRPPREGEGGNALVTEVWSQAGTCSARPQQPVRLGDLGSYAPRYAPGGGGISWLGPNSAGIMQVFAVTGPGQKPAELTHSSSDIAAFKWSPDGRFIAFLARSAPAQDLHAPIVDGGAFPGNALWIWSAETGEAEPLVTSGHVTDFDWSPDSARLVFAMAPSARDDDELLAAGLYIVDRSGGSSQRVAATYTSPLRNPRWSPDGRWVAWMNGSANNDPYPGSIYVMPSGGGAPRRLAGDENRTLTAFDWLPGNKDALLVRAIEGEGTVLYRFGLDGDIRHLDGDGAGLIVNDRPAVDETGRYLAVAAEAPDHPAEIYCAKLGQPFRRATDLNPGLAGVSLGRQKTVHWTAADGLQIGGVLVLPTDYREGEHYPLVVYVHGGSESAQLNGWYGSFRNWAQMLSSQGIAVLYPNYRGSTGHGPAFVQGEHDDVMGKSYADITAGIDFLVADGVADPERVGIAGYSWGGLASAWGATYDSARYKAAYVGGGISNWLTHSGTSITRTHDQSAHWNRLLHDGNYQLFLDRSPIAHVGGAHTPTLILHGGRDVDVPVAMGMELDYALRSQGIPVEFVVYPDEAHSFATRATQIDALQRIRRWFVRYLLGGDPLFPPKPQ